MLRPATSRGQAARHSGQRQRRGRILGDAQLGAVDQGDRPAKRDAGWVPRRVEGRNGPSAGRRGHSGSAYFGVSELRALGGRGPAAAAGAVEDDVEGAGAVQPSLSTHTNHSLAFPFSTGLLEASGAGYPPADRTGHTWMTLWPT